MLVSSVNFFKITAVSCLILFKGLVLQHMYNFSDVELEEQINDRSSFRRFVGLGVSDDVPDVTTFCRFRQDILDQKLSEKLFHLVLGQLLKGRFYAGCQRGRDDSGIIPTAGQY